MGSFIGTLASSATIRGEPLFSKLEEHESPALAARVVGQRHHLFEGDLQALGEELAKLSLAW